MIIIMIIMIIKMMIIILQTPSECKNIWKSQDLSNSPTICRRWPFFSQQQEFSECTQKYFSTFKSYCLPLLYHLLADTSYHRLRSKPCYAYLLCTPSVCYSEATFIFYILFSCQTIRSYSRQKKGSQQLSLS